MKSLSCQQRCLKNKHFVIAIKGTFSDSFLCDVAGDPGRTKNKELARTFTSVGAERVRINMELKYPNRIFTIQHK